MFDILKSFSYFFLYLVFCQLVLIFLKSEMRLTTVRSILLSCQPYFPTLAYLGIHNVLLRFFQNSNSQSKQDRLNIARWEKYKISEILTILVGNIMI